MSQLEGMIDTANNGKEAFEAVKLAYLEGKSQYCLILMDCSMPIMDGYDASTAISQYLQNRAAQVPMIVACTGHVEQEYVAKAWSHKMDEVIPKPVSSANIEIVLEELIEFNISGVELIKQR